MSDMMYVVMKTNKGDVVMELDHKMAPKSVENFMAYVNANYYDSTIFHRVIRDFMIQGGGFTSDMTQKSTNAPIVNEGQNGLLNTRGTLAMARTNDPNSATSQFFINTVDNQFLNANGRNPGYAVFGKVIDGMEVVDVIRAVKTCVNIKTKMGDVPVETVEIISIRPLPGPPATKK
ncbi:MAG: peptidyl-prolyl cis-trans isomerase [Phycisphaerales bacterium]|nr:peptidyl-prolyl cis-trans isomerase [Phycisphaerales bacterium]